MSFFPISQLGPYSERPSLSFLCFPPALPPIVFVYLNFNIQLDVEPPKIQCLIKYEVWTSGVDSSFENLLALISLSNSPSSPSIPPRPVPAQTQNLYYTSSPLTLFPSLRSLVFLRSVLVLCVLVLALHHLHNLTIKSTLEIPQTLCPIPNQLLLISFVNSRNLFSLSIQLAISNTN